QKKYIFEPDYAVPPGVTIEDTIEAMNMSKKEFAIRLDITPQSLNRILKGEQPLTYETANKLEKVTGTPARFWNNREAKYREQLIKLEERAKLEQKKDWLSKIPLKELISRGYIPEYENVLETFESVLSFFAVSNIKAWEDIWLHPKIATRRSECYETDPYNAATWIRMGEIEAAKINCENFDKNLFKENLKKISRLTKEKPEIFSEKMIGLCAEAGVALVFMPKMNRVPWNGATKWIGKDKVMIIVNLRGKREDKFWFSFFHEAAHVLEHKKKLTYIHREDDSNKDDSEKSADKFAENILIPVKYIEQIKTVKNNLQIIKLANKLNISPGIVAGRYQYITKKWNFYNDLIKHFDWA
ncbi:MAG: HigA family addiction module antidote protein, partial [Candidatus Cloacimonetes bacterium]|nr:HigA family addiction module antidote protein [Candidatus Cloacimonadota bacterium]